MSVGGTNPLPLHVGGGQTEFEKTDRVLRNAVGKGGSADDEDTVERAWRRSKALGLTATNADERAVMQWFPDSVTDFLPEFERILRIVVPPGASEQERRNAVLTRFVRDFAGIVPELREQLTEFDSRLDAVDVPHSVAKTTQAGRYFEPRDSSEPFGAGFTQTEFPNLSSDFYEIVHFDLGTGIVPTNEHRRTITDVEAELHEQLPAWMSFAIATEIGFTLDQTPLDVGVFGP